MFSKFYLWSWFWVSFLYMSLALDLVCDAVGPLGKLLRPFCPVQDFQKHKIAILKNPSSEGPVRLWFDYLTAFCATLSWKLGWLWNCGCSVVLLIWLSFQCLPESPGLVSWVGFWWCSSAFGNLALGSSQVWPRCDRSHSWFVFSMEIQNGPKNWRKKPLFVQV